MQIVLFVTLFLLIFGAISHSYFENYHKFRLEARITEAYLHTTRRLHNKMEERNAEKLKKKTAKPPIQREVKSAQPLPQKTAKTPSWDRNYYPPNKEGKISLLPLMELGKDSSLLHDIVLRYLNRLYKHTSFYEPELMSALLTSLIKKGQRLQKQGKSLTFSALYPEENNLQPLYYKLLRGTQRYTSSLGEDKVVLIGIPPLADFFSLDDKGGKSSINFSFAPSVLLEVLFGEKAAKEIYKKERASQKEKNKAPSTLSKEELSALIKGTLSPLLEFSQKKGKVIASEEEKSIGMVVRENVPD